MSNFYSEAVLYKFQREFLRLFDNLGTDVTITYTTGNTGTYDEDYDAYENSNPTTTTATVKAIVSVPNQQKIRTYDQISLEEGELIFYFQPDIDISNYQNMILTFRGVTYIPKDIQTNTSDLYFAGIQGFILVNHLICKKSV